MKLIDTHAHLDHLENLPQALENARQAGVEAIVAVGMDLASNRKNLEIRTTASAPKIYLAFGTHPSEVKPEELAPCLEFIRAHIQEIVAIGEIGLDFWYKWVRKDQQKHEEQRAAFRAHLELAQEFNLPVVIHSRGTWKECLKTASAVGLQKAVFHWYSGPVDVLKEILDAGYLISASPSLAYSAQSREAVSYAPIDRTLIETDCPVFYRDGMDTESGFKAEPKDVARTLKAYVELKKVDQEKAAEVFYRNAKEFFNLS